MRLDVNKLSSAVRLALSLGAVAAAGTFTANAQSTGNTTNTNQKSQALETIVVTGSNIRRVDIETSNPVVTIDSAAIRNSGKLTLGDIVQDLPAVTGGNTNPQVNNGGGSGSTTVGLRGLGVNRTLVLVNGQRIINKDLNSIPAAAVERVEVLTDGASAVYGSDAIGGVVNVILKKNYQGAEFSADYGISDHDDGERRGYHFIFGQSSDKGSIMAGIDYNKTDSVLSGNRKFSQNAVTLYGTNGLGPSAPQPPTAYVGGSTFPPYGHIQLPTALQGAYGCKTVALNKGASGSNPLTDYHCFQNNGPNSDKFNYATVNLIMTPQERTNLFVDGTYHLTDNVDAYFTGYHNKTSAGFQLAPALFGSLYGGTVSQYSIYNPFGVNFGPAASGGNDFRLRLVSAGNRAARTNNTTDQFSTGLKGTLNVFSQDWSWDAGYNYGHVSTVDTILGLPNLNVLNQATGPSMLVNGVPTCVATPGDPTTAIAGCTPINLFNQFNPNTVAQLQSIAAPALENVYTIEKTEHVDLNGGVFDLPAGTAELAVGGAYRKEYTHSVIDPVLQINPATGNCTLGSQCSSSLQGGYTVKEAYGELFVPVLKDLPFVNSLNVTFGDRYSKYSTFGSTNNWKAAIEYKPIEDLLLRGTVSSVFRAPSVANVYGNPVSDAPKLASDPCTFGGTGANPNAGNPACAGVPTTGPFTNIDVASGQQIKAVASGSKYANFPLGPESGKSFDLGFVYSPHWVDGLSFSADLYRVYLNNTISAVGAQEVLNQCFAGALAYCPLISRNSASSSAPGQIAQIIEPTGNLGRTDTKGLDMSVRYRLPQFAFGQFNVGLDATYLAQYDQAVAPGTASNIVYHDAGHLLPFGSAANAACPSGGGLCLFPRWRAQTFVNWNMGPWDASWRMRYIGKFRNGSGQASQDTFPAGTCYYGSYCNLSGYQLHYGATTYNDVQAGYNIEQLNTRLDVGIDNVSNKQPPFLYANNTLNANTDPTDFDLMGRYYWARVTVKF